MNEMVILDLHFCTRLHDQRSETWQFLDSSPFFHVHRVAINQGWVTIFMYIQSQSIKNSMICWTLLFSGCIQARGRGGGRRRVLPNSRVRLLSGWDHCRLSWRLDRSNGLMAIACHSSIDSSNCWR